MDIATCNWDLHESQDQGFTVFMIDSGDYPLHTHAGFSELVIARRGSFRHRINGQLLRQKERELVLIREHDTHELLGGDCEVMNVPFATGWLDRVETLLQAPGALQSLSEGDPPRVNVPEAFWPPLQRRLELLMHHADDLKGRFCFSDIFLSLMTDYFLKIPEAGARPTGLPGWLQQLLVDLNSHPTIDYGIRDLARMSGCTHEHLARSFRRYLKQTPSCFLNQRRLHRAAQLLVRTTLRISEISFRIGIDDPSYFCRLFKNAYGLSPSKYRRERAGVIVPTPPSG
jgi:AraC family cel operon transcriptional repressor